MRGMKPFAPEELVVDGVNIPSEGLMFVGDSGKILGGFEGQNPRIIPKKKIATYRGDKPKPLPELERRSDTWKRAIKSGVESPGSFLHASTVTEMINLGAAALRADKRLDYDSKLMKITHDDDDNTYLSRDYRRGWELG